MSKKCNRTSDEDEKRNDGNVQAGAPGQDTVNTENKDESEDRESAENAEAQPTVEEKLAESESKISQLIDQNLRQMAEFDNYRKRTLKEKAELIKSASADILTKILPVIDDMERAIANNAKSDDTDAIKEGAVLIYNKLMHILEGEGLKKIQAKGEQFDTDLHEAIAIIPATEDSAKNTVIDCTRDGYMLNDKVLRIAQVVVAN